MTHKFSQLNKHILWGLGTLPGLTVPTFPCPALAWPAPQHRTSLGPPSPILKSPSTSYPSPPAPATRRVESFFSYQPFYCPLLPGYTVIGNRTPGKNGLILSVCSQQFTRQRERVPSVRTQEAGKRCANKRGTERTPKGRERSQEGAYREACAVKSGREQKKVLAGPETPGEVQTPAFSPAPAQRASLAVTSRPSSEASTCRCSGRKACSGIWEQQKPEESRRISGSTPQAAVWPRAGLATWGSLVALRHPAARTPASRGLAGASRKEPHNRERVKVHTLPPDLLWGQPPFSFQLFCPVPDWP